MNPRLLAAVLGIGAPVAAALAPEEAEAITHKEALEAFKRWFPRSATPMYERALDRISPELMQDIKYIGTIKDPEFIARYMPSEQLIDRASRSIANALATKEGPLALIYNPSAAKRLEALQSEPLIMFHEFTHLGDAKLKKAVEDFLKGMLSYDELLQVAKASMVHPKQYVPIDRAPSEALANVSSWLIHDPSKLASDPLLRNVAHTVKESPLSRFFDYGKLGVPAVATAAGVAATASPDEAEAAETTAFKVLRDLLRIKDVGSIVEKGDITHLYAPYRKKSIRGGEYDEWAAKDVHDIVINKLINAGALKRVQHGKYEILPKAEEILERGLQAERAEPGLYTVDSNLVAVFIRGAEKGFSSPELAASAHVMRARRPGAQEYESRIADLFGRWTNRLMSRAEDGLYYIDPRKIARHGDMILDHAAEEEILGNSDMARAIRASIMEILFPEFGPTVVRERFFKKLEPYINEAQRLRMVATGDLTPEGLPAPGRIYREVTRNLTDGILYDLIRMNLRGRTVDLSRWVREIPGLEIAPITSPRARAVYAREPERLRRVANQAGLEVTEIGGVPHVSVPPQEDAVATALEEATRIYSQKPLAVSPSAHYLKHTAKLAAEEDNLAFQRVKNLFPQALDRVPELKEWFAKNGGKPIPKRTLEELSENVRTPKYRYDVHYVQRAQPTPGEITEGGGLPRYIYRILVHPYEAHAVMRSLPYGEIHTHAPPLSHELVPSIGWLKVYDRGDSWYIEEIQSDVLASIRRFMRGLEPGSPEYQELLNIEKTYRDWADYGLATVLRDAKEWGIPEVRVISSEAVQRLWGGRLGEAKAKMFYNDLPKRFGFVLGERYSKYVPAVSLVAAGMLFGSVDDVDAAEGFLFKSLSRLKDWAKLPDSSANKWAGFELWEGKRISAIKQKGNDRYVIFDDATYVKTNKQGVNALARWLGTKRSLEQFKKLPPEERLLHAQTSLEKRTQYAPASIEEQKKFWDILRADLEQFGLRPHNSVLVKVPPNDPNATVVQMPKEFAEILQQNGLVRIVESLPTRGWK